MSLGSQHLKSFNIVLFPVLVIACKPAFPPYAAALNPTDQVFDFEELEYHYLVANRTEDAPSKGGFLLLSRVPKIWF